MRHVDQHHHEHQSQPPATGHLRLLFESGTAAGVSDRELLDQFAARRDELAFTALVDRHGPMVQRVCHAVLHDHHDAQDAFQATFLVLARSADSIRRRDSLASWLHGVALRVARRARSDSSRRHRHEQASAALRESTAPDETAPRDRDDLASLLHDEIARLPERFRAPLVLCHLQGRTYEEAAHLLDCPVGTIKSRLSTARERLRHRLSRHYPAVLTGPAALALDPVRPLPASLLQAVVRSAIDASSVPAAIARLAHDALATMLPHRIAGRLGIAAALLIGTAALAAGAIALAPAKPRPALASQQAGPPVRPFARPIDDDPLPAGASLRFGTTRYRHPSTIESLAISPDGKIAVAGSGTRVHTALRTYDLATGRALLDLDRTGSAEGIAVSPDGKTLAIAMNWSHSIQLRDLHTGAETAQIRSPEADPGLASNLLIFTPDGNGLVTKSTDGKSLFLLVAATGKVRHIFWTGGTIFAAALSPDGKTLVAGGFDYQNGKEWFLQRWETTTGRELAPLPIPKGGIRSIAWSPDGKLLAIGGESRKPAPIALLDAATGKVLVTIPFPGSTIVRTVAFSPDSRTLAASGGWTGSVFDSTTRLFDTATGAERRKLDGQAIGLHFTDDGATLVGAVGGTIRRWDVATGRSLVPEGGDSSVDQVAATPDGRRLVTRGGDGDAHIWDARTGEHLLRLTVSYQRGLALSPDGRFLAWAERDDSIQFRDPDDARITHEGSRLRMIDVATGKPVGRFDGFEGDGHDLDFTDGGEALISVDHYRRDANIRIWDVATGRVTRTVAAGGPYAVSRSRLAPDGKSLAVLYVEQPATGLAVRQVVKLWDIRTGQEIERVRPWFDDDIVAYSPDRETAAVLVPNGGPIQLHDTATWQVLGEHPAPTDRPTALALGPDGRIYTGSSDGTVLAWEPPPRPVAPGK